VTAVQAKPKLSKTEAQQQVMKRRDELNVELMEVLEEETAAEA
jgi:hypothetical protein